MYIELLCCGTWFLPAFTGHEVPVLCPTAIMYWIGCLQPIIHPTQKVCCVSIKPAFIYMYIGRLVLYPDMKYTVHVLLKVSITPNMSVEIVGKLVKCYVLSYGKQFWTFTIQMVMKSYNSKLIFKISKGWSLSLFWKMKSHSCNTVCRQNK